MFCVKCGKDNTDDSRFCIFCGAEIPIEEPKEDASLKPDMAGINNKQTRKNTNRLPVILVITTAILLLFGLIIFAYIRINLSKEKSERNEALETELFEEVEEVANEEVIPEQPALVAVEEVSAAEVEQHYMDFLHSEVPLVWDWEDQWGEMESMGLLKGGRYYLNDLIRLTTNGELSDVQYALIDLGEDGLPELRLILRGAGIEVKNDDSTNEVIIKDRDGTLYACYLFSTWSRSSADCSYNGIIESFGSSGADSGGADEVIIDGNGQYYNVYTMSFYSLFGENVLYVDAFKKNNITSERRDTAFSSQISTNDSNWVFTEYTIGDKTYYGCDSTIYEGEPGDENTILGILSSLGVPVLSKSEIESLIDEREHSIEPNLTEKNAAYTDYPLISLDGDFYSKSGLSSLDYSGTGTYPIEFLNMTEDDVIRTLGKNYNMTTIYGGMALDYDNIWVFPDYEDQSPPGKEGIRYVAVLDYQPIADGIMGAISFPELKKSLEKKGISPGNLDYFYSELDSRNEAQSTFELGEYEISYEWYEADPNTSPCNMVWIQRKTVAASSEAFDTIIRAHFSIPEGFRIAEQNPQATAGYIYEFVNDTEDIRFSFGEVPVAQTPFDRAEVAVADEALRLSSFYGTTPVRQDENSFYMKVTDGAGNYLFIYQIAHEDIIYDLTLTVPVEKQGQGGQIAEDLIQSISFS